MAPQTNIQDSTVDLLVEQVTTGLSGQQYRELEQLLGDDPAEAAHELEAAAAAAAVVFCRRDAQADAMPSSLRDKLAREAAMRGAGHGSVINLAERRESRGDDPAARGESKTAGVFAGLGWALAAVMALVFVLVRPSGEQLPPVSEMRQAVLANSDAVQWSWRPGDDVQGWDGVTGDVVWSDAAQQGYMRFVGLPVNDPARSQYQLWIVDPERDTKPVDGGVFDAASSGEIIVPIQAKLDISNPRAFAVTEEKPGGVVVSAGPLVLVASLGPRPAAS